MNRDTELSKNIQYRPDPEFVANSNLADFMQAHDIDEYTEFIERSTGDWEGTDGAGLEWFWDTVVDYLDLEFYETYDEVADRSEGPQFADWYPGGTVNLAHNVVDRHANSQARDSLACIWEGEDGTVRQISFETLAAQSNQVANLIAERGVEAGETVGLFLPSIPESITALYGCFKAGVIAVPLFSGYGTEALATRIEDADPSLIFTADGFYRGGSEVLLKDTLDTALGSTETVDGVIVTERLEGSDTYTLQPNLDRRWADAVGSRSETYRTNRLDSDAASMLLYTSGTTGTPKGTIQTHAGQLVKCAKDIYFDFDHKPSDLFFWVTDPGWIMGPWTLIGNHAFGGTVFMYEGAPAYPDATRLWDMIERHSITTFGISPTAIRSFMGDGERINSFDLSSLRLLGSTGEPWDPDSWKWFYRHIGGGETPIVNVSGGTEMGGHFLSSPPVIPLKPCTVGMPSVGVDVDIVTDDGERVTAPNERGHLAVRSSCPSMTKSLWNGDDRYREEYWSQWGDVWDHSDWACRDEDDLWYILGRTDQVINIAGRTVGPAEVEAIALDHDSVVEAAAVGIPDDIKGHSLVFFVEAVSGPDREPDLKRDLRTSVSEQFGKPFRPDEVVLVDTVPKNQSGKIRREQLQTGYTMDSE